MNRRSIGVPAVLCFLVPAGAALAQTTTRVSVFGAATQANWDSLNPCVTPDGRFVAFELGLGTQHEVCVRDRLNATTEIVSVALGGLPSDGMSGYAAISADGRFVAFQSTATNLVPGDTMLLQDVLVRDRLLGTTERVSVDSNGLEANGGSFQPSISADGRFVAFFSEAWNLVPGDTNGELDVFVRDRLLGTTERASVSTTGAEGDRMSGLPSISADGRWVAFSSLASTLVPGDTNQALDVFVRDRLLGATERVSVGSNGSEGNQGSDYPSISPDGRFVAFESWSSSLVPGDTNGVTDVFLRDRQLGTTERVSLGAGGMQADGESVDPTVSADGRCVAFWSVATNLVAGDTNARLDVFLRDRQAGTTERVSVGSAGSQANADSSWAALSADGRCIVFISKADNLVAGDTNQRDDVFARDRGTPSLVLCFDDGSPPACPCGNTGLPLRGCDNSAATGGAQLLAAGTPSLANDTLVLTVSGALPHALSIFLQGSQSVDPIAFGDGVRCVGGFLRRLFVRNAVGGVVSVPQPGDPRLSVRSAAVGDVITPGTTRYYQTYYRDPVSSFCPSPAGNTFNISSATVQDWQQ